MRQVGLPPMVGFLVMGFVPNGPGFRVGCIANLADTLEGFVAIEVDAFDIYAEAGNVSGRAKRLVEDQGPRG